MPLTFDAWLAADNRRAPPAAVNRDVLDLHNQLRSVRVRLEAERAYSDSVDKKVEELTALLQDMEVQQQVSVTEVSAGGKLGAEARMLAPAHWVAECLLAFLAVTAQLGPSPAAMSSSLCMLQPHEVANMRQELEVRGLVS